MLSALPPSFPVGIVFDLHRAGRYDVTEQLLRRWAVLPVRLAREGLVLGPGCIYLAPHAKQLVVTEERRFGLLEPADGTGHRFADTLLASAARAFGHRLIAIVLSGRLEGGARGIREVKRHGGRVIVQDPVSAVAASMPTAALLTGCVDFSLTPDRIGDALVALCAATGAAELFRVRVNAAIGG
jgi:two-component system chemotaxis response regulator CheB